MNDNNRFTILCNVNIYLKNICRLICQSNNHAIDITYCHEQLDEQYKKYMFYYNKKRTENKEEQITKNNDIPHCILDYKTQKQWNALVDRKNNLVKNMREKNKIIEQQKEIISQYEKNMLLIKISKSTENKECETDSLNIQNTDNPKVGLIIEKENQLCNNNDGKKLMDLEKKNMYNEIIKENNDDDNCNYDEQEYDDKESIKTSSSTIVALMPKTRTMTQKEWKLYQVGIKRWILEYEQIPDMVDVLTGKKSLADWTPISILTDDFNHQSELNQVDNRTFGGLLRELKRKRSEEYEWLSTANKKWNIKRMKK